MIYFLIVAGFVLLLLGGEAVVRGSVSLAARIGVSPLIVGLTIVGFGTSLPEMVVSVNAALSGSPGLAIGNVVGSNIANVLLILGIAALILPIAVHPKAVTRDTLCLVGVTVVFFFIGMTGELTWWEGVLMLALLAGYIGLTVWYDSTSNDAAAEMHRDEAGEVGSIPLQTISIICIVFTGLFAVVVGAEWLVEGATTLARQYGVPEEVIGLTLVALGTSLPELATSIIAAYRGHPDVCVGNVIGSNIFNLFGIAGITALFAPLPFSDKVIEFDLWIMIGVALILVPFMVTGLRIGRLAGLGFLALYVAYIGAQFMGVGGIPH